MFKSVYYIELGFISSLIGLISEYFSSVKISYIILILLITIDTITGTINSIKFNRFNSKGATKIVKKIITYTLSVLSARLLEIGILELYNTTLVSQITIAYLIIAETISIFENLTLLGVPIPANLVPYIIRYFKIPGINSFLKNKETDLENYMKEIDDIFYFQIPTIDHSKFQMIVKLSFEMWKNVMVQIYKMSPKENESKDLFYYRVISFIQTGIADLDEQLEKNMSKSDINSFKKIHQSKVNQLTKNIKSICYANLENEKKKENILNNIIILLYKTIIDVRKEVNR